MFLEDLKRMLDKEATYTYKKPGLVCVYDDNGLATEVLKMKAASSIASGTLVKLSDNYTVAASVNQNVPIGQVIKSEQVGTDYFAYVLVHGIIEASYSSTAPSVGLNQLMTDANGKFKKDTTYGKDFLVLSVDTTATTVKVLLG